MGKICALKYFTIFSLILASILFIERATADSGSDVSFYLFTPENSQGQLIKLNDPHTLTRMGYNKNFPLKILCHGFTQNYLSDPGILTTLYPAYVACSEPININIIAVDWSAHSGRITISLNNSLDELWDSEYVETAKYTEKVGLATADLINFLVKYGTHPQDIHLLGFSLGAQCMGYAGFHSQKFGHKVARITGLDPAGPCFDKTRNLPCENIRHLEASDAQFVDIIHTDTKYLGISYAIGHIDFFVNEGRDQPNCDSQNELKIVQILVEAKCSHYRALLLYAESICNDMTFQSFKVCPHLETRQFQCDPTEWTNMGEYVNHSSRGVFYTKTNGRAPYSQSY